MVRIHEHRGTAAALAQSAVMASPPSHGSKRQLSVVVASVDSERSIHRCLSSLARSCRSIDAEILVVDASNDATCAIVQQHHPGVRIERRVPGTLTPLLWSIGYALSSGVVVAFTTGQCEVGDDWAHCLLGSIERGATGAGGALRLRDDAGPVDAAIFYLRYSAFLNDSRRGEEQVQEIPGDNAAYRREALERHAASFRDGFWEVDFHSRVRDQGARLVLLQGAEVQFGPAPALATLMRHRFAHGCHSGAWRVETGSRAAWQALLALPLVPIVLVFRIARRVLRDPSHRRRFPGALPALVILAWTWALGEAFGAIGHPSVPASSNGREPI